MQSQNKATTNVLKNKNGSANVVFFPLLILVFIFWVLYRMLFNFPVWFDETLGKAVFFGLPVWLYISITQTESITDTFAARKMKSGLLLGITVGGVLGFVFSILTIIQNEATVEAVSLFDSNIFWYEFALALFTAFWETLLFFSFVMTVIQEKFKTWSMTSQVLLVSIIFLLFHIPNILLRYDASLVLPQIFILFLFAIGQGFLFYTRRNSFALVLSHAIWGMVLLVHSGF
ncbi:MAG: CPBP family intramembrane metalloprotease [Pseudomonadales bacterium]|nr:CPBP family intramembrane metalloprotease [Pseudomonadales bacterium]